MKRPLRWLPILAAAFCALSFRGLQADKVTLEPPLVTVAPTARPPTIDGEVKTDEWKDAAAVTGFVGLTTGELVGQQTVAFITCDKANLYVGFKCLLPAGVKPASAHGKRDGPLWDDDAVEVFLDVGHRHGDYFQLIGNSGGAKWDSKGRDASWNAEWDYRAGIWPGHWDAEFRIPFASLGTTAPADGGRWGLNLARDGRTPTREISSWAFMDGSFHAPERFGLLVFRSAGPVARLLGLSAARDGGLAMQAEGAELALNLSISAGKDVVWQVSKALPRTADKPEPVLHKVSKPGTYKLRLAASTPAKEPIAMSEATLQIKPPVEVTLREYQLSGELEVEVNAKGAPAAADQLRGVVELRSAAATVSVAQIPTFDANAVASTKLDISKLAPGDYQLVAVVSDASGKELGRQAVSFKRAPHPNWLGSKAGVTDKVLPPWTPLRVHQPLMLTRLLTGRRETTVSPWGRTYAFLEFPLPSRVAVGKADILARPVRLALKADGADVAWRGEPVGVVSKRDDIVKLESGARSAAFHLAGSILVEYDGMIRSDLTLTPSAKTTLEQLTLEIPLKPNWAALFHFWPGKWGSAYNSGALPADGLSLPFKPFLWLGNEDGGLAWFMESDRGWSNADAKNVIEVRREKDAVVLRVRLIDKPTSVAEPLKYTVGFQATPVKPVPKDWHEWRVCHGASYGVESRPTRGSVALTYPALGRISLAQGTMEAWVTPTFDPQVKIENPASRGMYNREFFAVRLADGTIASLYWNIDDRGMRFYVKKGEQFPVLIGSHSDWKKDEPHHVALTWGAEARIYVDGRLLASKPFKGLLGDGNDQALDKAIIRFGGGLCDFILDEVRLSRVARADFDLTKPPAADAQTLLLDHLDGSVRGGTVDEGGAFVSAKFGQGLTLFLGGPPRTALDRAKERGVKTLVFHEHWTDIQNYTETTHEADLKRLVAACHERGIRLLLYFGYEMSNIAPEWPWYARECLTRSPDAPLPTKGGYHRQPEQYAFIVCYNSPWQDFLADGIQRVMDKYGVDGVYLDGTIEPWGCVNHRHGCGYQRPDGTWAPTYPIFAVRNLMKRLYAICSAKPGGMVNPHQSTCCTIPTLSFSHSYWDGEQFGGGELAGDPLKHLPLETFRAEFMGHNWGVPAEFLVYEKPPAWTFDDALAFTMLHDVCVRPGGIGTRLDQVSRIWQVWTDFGVKEAEWHPYWRNAHLVTAQPEGIKVSLYSRNLEVLLVVSNLSAGDAQASVRLALDRPGLAQGPRTATDALTQESLPICDGVIALNIPRMRMRIVWVK